MFTLSLPRTLVGVLLLSGAASAQAATLLVTVKNDSYDGVCNLHCSLRDAIAVANQSGTANTILLPSGTYLLTRPAALDGDGVPVDDADNLSGDLDISGDLRIRGAGSGKSRIEGRFNDRLIEVHLGARVIIEKLGLQGGNTAHNGGAIGNHGQLRLSEVLLRDNRAQIHPHALPLPVEEKFNHGHGGAIANDGQLTVLASRLEGNHALGSEPGYANPGFGGAIFNHGELLVRDSLLYANAKETENSLGTALYNHLGNARLERSGIVDNGAGELGYFAILNDGGELELTNSTLSGNVAGGLVNWPDSQATLSNVTITATYGTGLRNSGDMLVYNSVVAGNTDDTGEPSDCHNQGDVYSFQSSGLLTNSDGLQWDSCSADFFVPFNETFSSLLFPLSQQNDLLWLHALRPGGLAVDSAIGDCPDHDQRGVTRPQDGNDDGVAVCDLGAYEVSP
jgi:hypothetical protein